MHERHLQAEHDPPCSSGMTQEKHLQEGNYPRNLQILEKEIGI
jgi:hypothetical protein